MSKKDKQYNIALLGCGRIAERHARLLYNNEVANAHLTAVCDVDPSRAKLFGQKYFVNYYSNLHQMMRNENIDLVVVLTDSGSHFANVMELTNYKIDIIVEKPLALRVDHVDQMIMACDKAGVKLFVVKQNRFNLPVLQMRKALDKDRFGRLTMGTIRVRWSRDQKYYDQDSWRGTWLNDGGVASNQASHHIDLLQWFMGDVESVNAIAKTNLVDIEVEDTMIAMLTFKNGAVGLIEATTATRPTDLEGSISILGTQGTVEIGGFAVNQMKHWEFKEKLEGDEHVLDHFSVNPPDVYGFGHKAYYKHVIDCLDKDIPGMLSGYEGRKSVKLINALYASAERSKRIWMDDFNGKSKLGY